MKRIIILGSTGSLGKQALEVIKKYKKDFKVLALTSHKNKKLLDSQAKEFEVEHKVLTSTDGKEKLKRLCQLKEADIVIHIRLGDYMSTLIPSHWALPAEYYLSCIEMSSAKNIHIVTDDPNHSFLNNFSKLNPKIINGNVIQDFTYLTSAKKIILSRSSFSFWVGFLSEAEEIYSPNPDKGLWADGRQDLFVDDEERYKLVSVEV